MSAHWTSLEAETAATGADVPGGAVLLEQMEQSDVILGQKTTWFGSTDVLRPEHELDLSSVAAFAAQGECLLNNQAYILTFSAYT